MNRISDRAIFQGGTQVLTALATVRLIFISMRPKQWTKNFVVLAPLLFSQSLFDPIFAGKALAALFIFCIISGTVYLLNDIMDIESDRFHPTKSKRPLASGQLTVPGAMTGFVLLAIFSVAFSLSINISFTAIVLGYFFLQVTYSRWLKHVVLLDIFSISIGFVLRAVGGAVAIGVAISSWLLICTQLFALFLALGKRRHEIVLLNDRANDHRRTLGSYSCPLIDSLISVVTASTVMAYSLYTLSQETIAKFGTDDMKYTIPFVLYGIFRYLYLIHQKNGGGSPDETLLTDKPLIINILLYGVISAITLYF